MKTIWPLIAFAASLALMFPLNTCTYAWRESKNFQKFNFVTAGDFGCGDEPNRTIGGMVKKSPELTLALGDLSYNKYALCGLKSITPLESNRTVKITFGDQDLTKKMRKYNDYLRYFKMTKPFYNLLAMSI